MARARICTYIVIFFLSIAVAIIPFLTSITPTRANAAQGSEFEPARYTEAPGKCTREGGWLQAYQFNENIGKVTAGIIGNAANGTPWIDFQVRVKPGTETSNQPIAQVMYKFRKQKSFAMFNVPTQLAIPEKIMFSGSAGESDAGQEPMWNADIDTLSRWYSLTNFSFSSSVRDPMHIWSVRRDKQVTVNWEGDASDFKQWGNSRQQVGIAVNWKAANQIDSNDVAHNHHSEEIKDVDVGGLDRTKHFTDYLYADFSDQMLATSDGGNYPGSTGLFPTSVGRQLQKEGVRDGRMIVWQRVDGSHNDAPNNQQDVNSWQTATLYYETPILTTKTYLKFGMVQRGRGFWDGRSPNGYFAATSGAAGVQFSLNSRSNARAAVFNFYDSPVMDPSIYRNATDLPKGVKLRGYFVNDNGEKIPGVRETIDGKCRTWTDGDIDFSGDDLAAVWARMGQSEGIIYELPKQYNVGTNVYFRMEVYEDAAFSAPADMEYSKERETDRQRTGYVKALDGEGNVRPLKVQYYMSALNYSPKNHIFEFHIRPWVLKNPQSDLPLNPSAISPYNDLVKWITLSDEEFGRIRSNPQAAIGFTFRKQVVPHMLDAVCRINALNVEEAEKAVVDNGSGESSVQTRFVPSHLDLWEPGTYYEDAGPWIVGDGKKIAFHQTGYQNRSSLTLTCWGEKSDPLHPEQPVQKVPVKSYVVLDGESTDGGPGLERLAMNVPGAQGYYPLIGYSTCTAYNRKALMNNGWWPSWAKTAQGTVKRVSSSGERNAGLVGGIDFTNPGGRCGELNRRYDIAAPNGLVFGPAVMLNAPLAENANAEQEISISMTGLGKEAIAFGLVMGGDTSNADISSAMAPVYQYSALNFNAALSDDAGRYDWTDPSNYNRNFFYYGSRVGKRSKAYDPNDTDLLLRDGSGNDGLNAREISIQLGNDEKERTQKLALPYADSRTGAGIATNLLGKYLLSEYTSQGGRTYTATSSEHGAVLLPVNSANQRFSISVPCGKNFGVGAPGTAMRAWADFNGNGAFDPGEASDLAECQPQKSTLRTEAEFAHPSSELPWTATDMVTLTFPYPQSHNLNPKANVWIRVRAVTSTDKAVLADDAENTNIGNLSERFGLSLQRRTENPDADASLTAVSTVGATAAAPKGGETEDYLFEISGGIPDTDAPICVPSTLSDQSQTIPLEETARSAIEKEDTALGLNAPRTLDTNSFQFVAGQDGVTVSRGGTYATTSEGTWEIKGTNARFTPNEATAKAMKELAAQGKERSISPLRVAYLTGENDDHARVAGVVNIRARIASNCAAQITGEATASGSGGYAWEINKEILKNNFGETWVKDEKRQLPDAQVGTPIPTTYRIQVTAKREVTTLSSLSGTLSVHNSEQEAQSLEKMTITSSDSAVTCAPSDLSLPVTLEPNHVQEIAFSCEVTGSASPEVTLEAVASLRAADGQVREANSGVITPERASSTTGGYADNQLAVLYDYFSDFQDADFSRQRIGRFIPDENGVIQIKTLSQDRPTWFKSMSRVRDSRRMNLGQAYFDASQIPAGQNEKTWTVTFTVPESERATYAARFNSSPEEAADKSHVWNTAMLCKVYTSDVYGDHCDLLNRRTGVPVDRSNPDTFAFSQAKLTVTPSLAPAGELPATGGHGVALPVLAGALLCLLSLAWYRRQSHFDNP